MTSYRVQTPILPLPKLVNHQPDDHQHTVTLERIVELDENLSYPRVVSQNKPKYSYCEVCEKLGRKTVATWICIDCSNEEGRDVLLCDDCVAKGHEDHYAEDMIY